MPKTPNNDKKDTGVKPRVISVELINTGNKPVVLSQKNGYIDVIQTGRTRRFEEAIAKSLISKHKDLLIKEEEKEK